MQALLLNLSVGCDYYFFTGAQNGAVRLIQNGSSLLNLSAGTVEVFVGGEWGGICYDRTFNMYAADVICHQLGYVAATSFYNSSHNR